MNKIIEKCDVCINGSVVSKELLIKTFSSFVSSTIEDKQHNVGIVLHTGSVCFDAILLSLADNKFPGCALLHRDTFSQKQQIKCRQ